MNKTFHTLLVSVFVLLSIEGIAQEKQLATDTTETFSIEYTPPNYPYDSTLVEPRSFDQSKLDALTASSDFVYIQEDAQTYSIWDQILRWLAEMIAALFFSEGNGKGIRYFIYGVATITFCYVLMKLMGIETAQLLYRRGKVSKLEAKVLIEDLEGIDFSQAIQDAVQKQDYRSAVRFLYLFMLKKMDEKELIEWKENKTNHELELELKQPKLKKDFEKATYLFERIYYGAFQVKQQQYEQAKTTFGDIDQKMALL